MMGFRLKKCRSFWLIMTFLTFITSHIFGAMLSALPYTGLVIRTITADQFSDPEQVTRLDLQPKHKTTRLPNASNPRGRGDAPRVQPQMPL